MSYRSRRAVVLDSPEPERLFFPMYPHDYHLHTHFSGDNDASMEEMCRSAVALQIGEIAFTEHFDVNPKENQCGLFPLQAWSAELERCRKLFAGWLVIKAGLEAGEPHVEPALVSALVARYPFDLVIGSVHWVRDRIVFERDYFERPAEDAFLEYFEETERLTRMGTFQVLGHLDVVARVGFDVYGAYDPARYEGIIRVILRNCIDRGIIPEINAGAMRRPVGRLMPGLETLKWYVSMGGESVTLGSDAHQSDQVGLHLGAALEAAREAGIKYLVRFDRLRPTPFPLP